LQACLNGFERKGYQMLIRKARIEDESSVISLLKQFPNGLWGVNWEAAARTFREIVRNPELGTILVAEDDGEAVGVTTLSYPTAIRCGGLYCCIEENIVDARCRGKGVGGRLLKAAIAEAASKECDEIQVNGPSEMGYPLYLRHGFKDIGKHLKTKLPLQDASTG
jgi:predicted N-acetyltransferase YhbS